jgi:hypothetical protein
MVLRWNFFNATLRYSLRGLLVTAGRQRLLQRIPATSQYLLAGPFSCSETNLPWNK